VCCGENSCCRYYFLLLRSGFSFGVLFRKGFFMKSFLNKEISPERVYSRISKLFFWSFPIGFFGGLMIGFWGLYK